MKVFLHGLLMSYFSIHSLSQPDVSNVAQEKVRRAQLLTMNQELARQVTKKSREAAGMSLYQELSLLNVFLYVELDKNIYLVIICCSFLSVSCALCFQLTMLMLISIVIFLNKLTY